MRKMNMFGMFGLIAIMVIAMAVEVECRAVAVTWENWGLAYTHDQCGGNNSGGTLYKWDVGTLPRTSTTPLICSSSGVVAMAWIPNAHIVFAAVKAWAIPPGWASGDKSAQIVDTNFMAVDTSSAEIVDLGGGNARLILNGKMKSAPLVNSHMVIEVFDHADTLDSLNQKRVIWRAEIDMAGPTGNLQVGASCSLGAGFVATLKDSITYISDTAILKFSNVLLEPIPYSGPFDSVGVKIDAEGNVNHYPAPALTEWGMIILLALLLLSGIIVIRRRKALAHH